MDASLSVFERFRYALETLSERLRYASGTLIFKPDFHKLFQMNLLPI
jgi:hypothetical protein